MIVRVCCWIWNNMAPWWPDQPWNVYFLYSEKTTIILCVFIWYILYNIITSWMSKCVFFSLEEYNSVPCSWIIHWFTNLWLSLWLSLPFNYIILAEPFTDSQVWECIRIYICFRASWIIHWSTSLHHARLNLKSTCVFMQISHSLTGQALLRLELVFSATMICSESFNDSFYGHGYGWLRLCTATAYTHVAIGTSATAMVFTQATAMATVFTRATATATVFTQATATATVFTTSTAESMSQATPTAIDYLRLRPWPSRRPTASHCGFNQGYGHRLHYVYSYGFDLHVGLRPHATKMNWGHGCKLDCGCKLAYGYIYLKLRGQPAAIWNLLLQNA